MKKAAGTPHLLHVFSTFVPAGPEMRTVRMINALGESYRHSILAIDDRTDAQTEFDATAPVRILPGLPRAGTASTVSALRRLIRREQPDLLLSYNWGAFDSVFASRSLYRGNRHLHHEDGFNADEADSFKSRRVWTRRLLLPGVARTVVPSEVLMGVATKTWKLKPKHIQLIPNGIDLDSFTERDGNPALRAELGISPETPVIGFVGHLRPVKNTQRLLRAFAAVRCDPMPELVMLGEGEEREAIAKAAIALNIQDRLHLVGHKSDTAPWYRLMDLFAISSDSEQMPVALLEAMATSLPVVSTGVGDVAHMLCADQAPFVSAGAPSSWESQLTSGFEKMIASVAQRQTLGKANRERVEEHYSFDSMLESYRTLYDSILGN
ncbi:MAG: glycosyltransferase involved in cell wall biosynthesis [Planctomycetota bacterium]